MRHVPLREVLLFLGRGVQSGLKVSGLEVPNSTANNIKKV